MIDINIGNILTIAAIAVASYAAVKVVERFTGFSLPGF